MATTRIELDDLQNNGYEFPSTGETIEIYCDYNDDYGMLGFMLFSPNNENVITNVTVEDGEGTAEVLYDGSSYPYAWFVYNLSPGDYFTISLTVPANLASENLYGEVDYFDSEDNYLTFAPLSQPAYTPPTPPTPTWGDGQHKIYRSGNLVKKMYRSGELIYLRLNPPTE